MGQRLSNQNETLNVGKQNISFNTQGLVKGIYFVNVILNDDSTISRKVVVE